VLIPSYHPVPKAEIIILDTIQTRNFVDSVISCVNYVYDVFRRSRAPKILYPTELILESERPVEFSIEDLVLIRCMKYKILTFGVKYQASVNLIECKVSNVRLLIYGILCKFNSPELHAQTGIAVSVRSQI
jgi:hypothetical protein